MNLSYLPPRFQKKIIPVTESGCWLWLANATPKGYGRTRLNGKETYSHRAVYEILVGPIDEGLEIDHLCRVRECCNPAHLEPVTTRVNSLRSGSFCAKNKRKTHCPSGHPYAGDNLHILPNGHRKCKTCHAATFARFKRKHPTYMRDYQRMAALAKRTGTGFDGLIPVK